MTNIIAIKKRIKQCLISLFLMVFLISSTSCFLSKPSTVPELKQETHKPLEDIEQYVYDALGPDIYFKKPVFDEEASQADLYLIQYEGEVDMTLFDRARNAVNEYLMLHPDYCLNDYDYIVLNYEKRKNLPGSDYDDYPIARSKNSFHCGCHMVNRFGTGVDGVNIRYDRVNVVYAWSYFEFMEVSDTDDVFALDMRTDTVTYSEITDFIIKHPSLQYMIVYRYDGDIDELIKFLQETDSDVEIFIDEFEG